MSAISNLLKHAPQLTSAGILGMEVYFPKKYVSQTKLEKFDGVSAGKYTIGLGQRSMAFVDEEREDSVSMMMNAVQGLLDKYSIDPKQVARLVVGTETPIDKSKSIKTFLMPLFGSNTDIEGVDCINACYGGTAALFDSVYWLEACKNVAHEKDKYSIVVCGDIATYEPGAARPTGGAGTIAMLLGHNATLQFNLSLRASHFENAYDFYKPDPKSPYPKVDGGFSNTCYLRAVDNCYTRLVERGGGPQHCNVSNFEEIVFHSPYNKLVKKSMARLVQIDSHLNEKFPEYLQNDAKIPEKTKKACEKILKTKTLETTYTDNESMKNFMDISSNQYNKRIKNGLLLPQELGNCYTASLFNGLASSVYKKGARLNEKDILLFSYGSGLASTCFVLHAKEQELQKDYKFSLENMKKVLNLDKRLNNRIEASPEEYTRQMSKNLQNYLHSDYEPKSDISYIERGAFYLSNCDKLFRRKYTRKE